MSESEEIDRPDFLGESSLILEVMFNELTGAGRSSATIDLYLRVAKRFEDHLMKKDPPVFADELELDEAHQLVKDWFQLELSPTVSKPTAATYRTIMATYLNALDGTFGRENLVFRLGVEANKRQKDTWAGRPHPSEPLDTRQLARIRQASAQKTGKLWIRTAIELALAGLTIPEIMKVRAHHVSLFGQPQIRCLERSVPILDPETTGWIDFLAKVTAETKYPRDAVSERTVKRVLTREVAAVRKNRPYGSHQGIRTLHNTGARQMLRAGRKPERVRKIYGRANFPESWNRRST